MKRISSAQLKSIRLCVMDRNVLSIIVAGGVKMTPAQLEGLGDGPRSWIRDVMGMEIIKAGQLVRLSAKAAKGGAR